jgi:uncharacterized protein (DUF2062 family)
MAEGKRAMSAVAIVIMAMALFPGQLCRAAACVWKSMKILAKLRLIPRPVLPGLRRLLTPGHKPRVVPERDRIRTWFFHPVRLYRMLVTEHATPAGLGLAAALGVFLGALPLFALHTVVIIFVASRLKLNRLMGVVTQNICMPPVVPFICIELGYYLRYGEWLGAMTLEAWGHQAPQRLWEWLLGSLIVGPVLAVITGLLVFWGVKKIQRKQAVNEASRKSGGQAAPSCPAGAAPRTRRPSRWWDG